MLNHHKPLSEPERQKLLAALRGNAQDNLALLMDRRDTTFAGTAEEVPDEEVIFAIKSIPMHF